MRSIFMGNFMPYGGGKPIKRKQVGCPMHEQEEEEILGCPMHDHLTEEEKQELGCPHHVKECSNHGDGTDEVMEETSSIGRRGAIGCPLDIIYGKDEEEV